MLSKCCYTTALMYAYYNSHKLFFMSTTITEMIPATRKATLAVILVECLGNVVFTKSMISILISLMYMRVFALYLCYTPCARDAMAVKASRTLMVPQTMFLCTAVHALRSIFKCGVWWAQLGLILHYLYAGALFSLSDKTKNYLSKSEELVFLISCSTCNDRPVLSCSFT